MKKTWTTYLPAIFYIFFCSCTSDNHQNSYRIHSNFSQKINPSESMWANGSKNQSYSFLKSDEEKVDESSKENYETVDEMLHQEGKYVGEYKVGNPYEIFGVSYFPQEYEDFEEIGTASWYGDDFHGKKTANGEIYNMEEMTAAHRTLPLPSMVRITNLQNDKTAIVRVNDRGPFAKNRIIDVSEKAAIALGFKDNGTTQVKVELLRNETDELLTNLGIKN